MDDFENLVRLSQAFPELDSPGGTICEPNDKPAGLAPPRHGLRAADAVGQALHGLGDLGPERRGHDRDGRDPLRRARGDRGHAGVAVAHQRQLAAALRRPHAQRARRLREGQPADDHHALPAHGRDVAGLDPRDAGPADGRGAGGHRADRSSSAPAARSSSARSSRTPTCSPARRRSARPSRPSACCAPGRSRAPSGCRGARAAA